MLTKCVRVLVALLLLEGAAQAQNVQTGTLSAANGFVRLGLRGEPGVGFAVNGTWSGTITFQCSADGARFDALNVALPSSSSSATTTTSNGTFQGTSTGCLVVQAVMTAYTSGTATIAIVSSDGPAPVSVSASSSGNAAASATGAAVPSSADYQGVNIGGNLTGQTGFSLGTARAGAVAIVDGSGNQITSFGGGTQYATGSAQATPTGTAALGWDGTSVRVLKTDTSGNLLLGAFQATPTVNAAQSGNWTARIVGNTGAVLDFAGQNASSPANAVLLGGQFNTSPTTITSGNASPIQLDSAGRVLVDCTAGCGGSGGTSAADNAAFTQGTTSETPIAGLASTNDAAYTTATTGHNTIWQLTTKGHGVTNGWMFDSAGTGVVLNGDGGVPAHITNGSATATINGTANTAVVGGTDTNNTNAAGANRVDVLDGIAQTDFANGTAYTQGRNVSADVFTDGGLHVVALPAMRPASYTASSGFAGSSTTDNAVLPGNASNTVLVTDVVVTCTQTTAGSLHLQIIKRSTADTSGTSASMTVVPDDSNYAAGVSAPLSYTGTGPTAGTAVGNIDDAWIGCNATGTAGPNDVYVGNFHMKPIVLRGTAQQLAVNFSNAAITGGNITVRFKWIETKTITP